jgi:hypothetical protein
MLLKALSNFSIGSELLTRVSSELFDEFPYLHHLLSFFDQSFKNLINQPSVKTGIKTQESLSESLLRHGRITQALLDPV